MWQLNKIHCIQLCDIFNGHQLHLFKMWMLYYRIVLVHLSITKSCLIQYSCVTHHITTCQSAFHPMLIRVSSDVNHHITWCQSLYNQSQSTYHKTSIIIYQHITNGLSDTWMAQCSNATSSIWMSINISSHINQHITRYQSTYHQISINISQDVIQHITK